MHKRTIGLAHGRQARSHVTCNDAWSSLGVHHSHVTERDPIGSDMTSGSLRRLVIGVAVLIGLGFLLNATLTRIDAGHVGIKVNLAGSARGVQDIPSSLVGSFSTR